MVDRWIKEHLAELKVRLQRLPLPSSRVRRVLLIALAVAVFAFALARPAADSGILDLTSPSTTRPPPPVGPVGSWEFRFGDEFDDAIDSDDWSRCYPWANDGCTNPGNNELQWYQDDNVSDVSGRLRLEGREREITGDDGNDYDYTSGMVTTGAEPGDFGSPPKFDFQYGYVEARVKVPKGQGLWPAVWLLPSNQDWPPEIDLMEILGNDTTTAYLTNHFEGTDGEPDQAQGMARGVDYSLDFHTFGVDWRPDSITWYVDGIEQRRYTVAQNIPQEPMYLVMNLAIGGDWPGRPARNTPFPAHFDVDWVRIWQQA